MPDASNPADTPVVNSLSDEARTAWSDFLGCADNRGHAHRRMEAADIEGHFHACMASARSNAQRIFRRHGQRPTRRILEIGCSTGVNSIALAERFPEAEVVGIEPERAALVVAQVLTRDMARVRFCDGVAEQLPLPDNWADIVVCHTVLEHVYDVRCALAEMVRVLNKGGTISLEAPNYRFPYEPHLGVWCIPALGKHITALLAGVQGRWRQRRFLDHLQFITTPSIRRQLQTLGCSHVQDEAEEKMAALAQGTATATPGNTHLARALGLCRRAGLGPCVSVLAGKLALFPSMLLVARR